VVLRRVVLRRVVDLWHMVPRRRMYIPTAVAAAAALAPHAVAFGRMGVAEPLTLCVGHVVGLTTGARRRSIGGSGLRGRRCRRFQTSPRRECVLSPSKVCGVLERAAIRWGLADEERDDEWPAGSS
jgi:hypothetical protein